MVARAFDIEVRQDEVAVVRLDVPGQPLNLISGAFVEELDGVLDDLSGANDVRAVVFTSAKPDAFIAGVDLEVVLRCRDAAQGTSLARTAQRITGRIAALEKPVVAAIHGACFGAGLELAVACDARVASDDRATRLGHPEIHLGLLPGAGGTQRLPRLVGVQRALELFLGGRRLGALEALEVALVDEVVPRGILVDVAARHALRLAETARRRETFRERLSRLFSRDELESLAVAENPVGRRVVFEQARRRLADRARWLLPVGERLLDTVRAGLERGPEAGLEAEARAFGEVATAAPSRELVRLFLARRAIDHGPLVPNDTGASPRTVHRVGVLGCGLMGTGIAYVTADCARLPVRLKDRDDDRVGEALRRLRGMLERRRAGGRIDPLEMERRWHHITPTVDYRGFERCDVVIEAVYEDLELKRQVLREVEAVAGPDVIFASNASALPIADIAAASVHPETVIGMHYFSPVARMPLVEVVPGPRTAPWVTATCVALARSQGKTAIVVKDGPGFFTTRILAPLLSEAGHLVSEGASIEAVDRALVEFGFPVGPFRLLDEIGLDVSARVNTLLAEAYGPRIGPWPGLRWLVDDRRYGKKNGRGFYRARGEVDASVYPVLGVQPRGDGEPSEDLAWRCVLRLVNEALWCHGEGVLGSTRDGDVGAVLGVGFPAYRGGPFRLVDALGPRDVHDRLVALRDRHGVRFEPAPLLAEMAEEGVTFYGEGAVPAARAPRTGEAGRRATPA